MASVKTLTLLLAAGLCSAETIRTDSDPGRVFKPDDVSAKVGDVLESHFLSHNDSVAKADLANACQIRLKVETTSPTSFYRYYTQKTHSYCQVGMVGAVNTAWVDSWTLDAYEGTCKGYQRPTGDGPGTDVGQGSSQGPSSGEGSGSGGRAESEAGRVDMAAVADLGAAALFVYGMM